MSKFSQLVRNYRDSLNKEIEYPHWSPEERQVLKNALRWFDREVDEITENPADLELMNLFRY
jgi:hypothetical protein